MLLCNTDELYDKAVYHAFKTKNIENVQKLYLSIVKQCYASEVPKVLLKFICNCLLMKSTEHAEILMDLHETKNFIDNADSIGTAMGNFLNFLIKSIKKYFLF